jgi:hypothetical protein
MKHVRLFHIIRGNEMIKYIFDYILECENRVLLLFIWLFLKRCENYAQLEIKR